MVEEGARIVPLPGSEAVELRHLRSFVTVAEELNFRRAAERLFITQPALSRQISALERMVGTALLRRNTRRVELTLAGEVMLARAYDLLNGVDEAVRAVQSVGGEIIERIVRLWQPVERHDGDARKLPAQRAAYESLLAHVELPAGIQVRPINAGGVPSLVTTPDPELPSRVLYLHGGGFVLGSAFGYRPLTGALAKASETGVVAIDYRLAPEHPFPAALDDARSAYLWMLDQLPAGESVSIAGDSTGAGLALALLLRLRSEGARLPAGVALLCPNAADLTLATPESDDPDRQLALEVRSHFATAYLAGHPADDPLVSPVLGNWTGWPPLLIQAGSGDILRSEAEAVRDQAEKYGVPSTFELYPTDAHVFQLFWSFLPEAAEAIDAAGRFLAAPTAAADVAGAIG